MKICIISNNYKNSIQAKKLLTEKLSVDFSMVEDDPDLVIAVGGDGTFLSAVNKYLHLNPIFLGVNGGQLGFYSSYSVDEIDDVVNDIKNEKLSITDKTLIELKDKDKTIYALNEITIINPFGTARFNVKVNGEILQQFRGTGIAFGTQMGSTGFTKSIGGAVIFPGINVMQMMELAPVSHNMYRPIGSPIIMCEEHNVSIENMDVELVAVADGAFRNNINTDKVEISIADKEVKLVHRPNHGTYVTKLRKTFSTNN